MKGSIPITFVLGVSPHQVDARHPWCLSVACQKRTYFCAVKNRQEMDDWRQAILTTTVRKKKRRKRHSCYLSGTDFVAVLLLFMID
jgi:hypothetical protein